MWNRKIEVQYNFKIKKYMKDFGLKFEKVVGDNGTIRYRWYFDYSIDLKKYDEMILFSVKYNANFKNDDNILFHDPEVGKDYDIITIRRNIIEYHKNVGYDLINLESGEEENPYFTWCR